MGHPGDTAYTGGGRNAPRVQVQTEAPPQPTAPVPNVDTSAAQQIAREIQQLPPEQQEQALDRLPPQMLDAVLDLSLIHISEPTRLRRISYAVFCLKKKMK